MRAGSKYCDWDKHQWALLLPGHAMYQEGWTTKVCTVCDCHSGTRGIESSEHEGGDPGSPRSTEVDSRSTDDLEGPQIFGNEAADVLVRFLVELQRATGDGARKRRTGSKPPWYRDDSHEAAMYRHLERWESGERHDPEHEAHPLVAAAWRALAIACKESGNVPNG